MDSILNTIKEMLGIDKNDSAVDVDIIAQINNAIMILRQLGIGPKEGFKIEGQRESWADLTNDSEMIESVKVYIYLKAKTLFDPTSSSVVSQAYKEEIRELEWRLNSEADYGEENTNA